MAALSIKFKQKKLHTSEISQDRARKLDGQIDAGIPAQHLSKLPKEAMILHLLRYYPECVLSNMMLHGGATISLDKFRDAQHLALIWINEYCYNQPLQGLVTQPNLINEAHQLFGQALTYSCLCDLMNNIWEDWQSVTETAPDKFVMSFRDQDLMELDYTRLS